ncbi:MAG TPA: Ku protein [Stellaceae bacterium]|jgi:DNA end-binding protein Ku|nr:Ku protein [Stellaceae bacterium]
MPEAVWNGFLRLSLVSCPVRLALATNESHLIRLDRVNARTGNPVAQQFVDSRTGDVVNADAVMRAYRGTAAGLVALSDSDLEGLAGESPNIIDLAQFSRHGQIDRARFDRSYYVYPDGQLAADTLDALRLAMLRSNRDAIAYVRIGDRERMVVIQAHGPGLMLSTLRPPRILEPAAFVERPETAIPPEMVEIAEGIIARRLFDDDANAMFDRYEARLRSLIESKGASVPAATAAAPSPVSASPVPEQVVLASPPPPPPAPESVIAAPPPEPVVTAPPPPPPPEPVVAAPPPPPPEPEPEPEVAVAPPPPAPEPEPEVAAAPPPPPAPEPEPEPEAAVTSPPAPRPEPEVASPPPHPEPEIAAAPPAPEPPPASPPEPAPEMQSVAEQRAFTSPPPDVSVERELPTEILLHIMGLGDRRFVEPGWAGHPGSHRQIEAMSIRPREDLEPSAIEFRVFAQEGRATAWVSNGNYAGTRGRQLPLTGFAVRPAPELRDRFDIVYEGCFFDGGVVGPKRNGEICTSSVSNDPLEAVRVSIVQRRIGPAPL